MEAGLFTRTANSSNRAAGCREAYAACLRGVTSRGWSQAGRSPDPFPGSSGASGVDDECGRRAIAEPLPLRRRPHGDRCDEVDEEEVDRPEQVSYDRLPPADRAAVVVDDT